MIGAVALALAVPLLLGQLLLAAARFEAGNAEERWGHAWLAGAATLATAMVLLGRAGTELTFERLLISCAILAAAFAVAAFWRRAPRSTLVARLPLKRMVLALAVLVLLRAGWIVAEARIVPEHMTDAVENWLLRAKVIATLHRVPTDPRDPYYLAGGRVSYPLGMPMLAAWPAILHGAWDERLVNTVWPAYFVALLATACGGVARRAGASAGWITAYLLSSLPLVAVHAVRSGYADLLLAAHLLAACLLWCDAMESRRGGVVLLAAVNSLFCVLLKREGIVFLALLMTCVMIESSRRSSRRGGPIIIAGLLLAAGVGLVSLGDTSFVHAELSGLGWHPEAIRAIGQRLFTWDTWNLLWWFAVPLLPLALWRLWRRGERLLALIVIAFAAFTAAVFLFTANAAYAVNGWTFDRSVLQIMPLCVVAAALGLTTTQRASQRE